MQKRPFSVSCHFLIAVIALASFQSCIGPKKMNKWVTKQYGDQLSAPAAKKTPGYLSVTTSLPLGGSEGSTGERKISKFLPLLVYWQWDDKLNCTLNPKIPVNNFTTTANSYAAKKGLQQKLGTQRIELNIDKLPGTFAVDDKAHVIFLAIYTYTWDFVSIQPEKQDMVVSYRVLQGDAEVKKGTITVPDINKIVPLHMFQSVKKKTWSYLEDYDANITTMTKRVIDKLVDELQDYYPGGSVEPGRSYNAGAQYRYGFNGKENDNDIENGAQDYGMRIYDSRIVRFLSVDPITAKYPELTLYQFASNRPIDGIDEDGLEYSPAGQANGFARDGTAVRLMPLHPKTMIEIGKQIQRIDDYPAIVSVLPLSVALCAGLWLATEV